MSPLQPSWHLKFHTYIVIRNIAILNIFDQIGMFNQHSISFPESCSWISGWILCARKYRVLTETNPLCSVFALLFWTGRWHFASKNGYMFHGYAHTEYVYRYTHWYTPLYKVSKKYLSRFFFQAILHLRFDENWLNKCSAKLILTTIFSVKLFFYCII